MKLRSAGVSALGGVAAAALWCGPGAAAHNRALAALLRVPLTLEALPGVALTFDDGPHPEGTPAVLEALDEAGARATFFLVGEQVRRHPRLVDRILAAGHECGVHADLHRNQMRLTPGRFRADLERAIATISDAGGRRPSWYRPPYGVFTPAGLRAVRRAELRPLLWSRWGRDWRADTQPERIASRAAADARRGDVVLLHDADTYCAPGAYIATVAALPTIVAALGRRGLAAMTVAEVDRAQRSRPPSMAQDPSNALPVDRVLLSSARDG